MSTSTMEDTSAPEDNVADTQQPEDGNTIATEVPATTQDQVMDDASNIEEQKADEKEPEKRAERPKRKVATRSSESKQPPLKKVKKTETENVEEKPKKKKKKPAEKSIEFVVEDNEDSEKEEDDTDNEPQFGILHEKMIEQVDAVIENAESDIRETKLSDRQRKALTKKYGKAPAKRSKRITQIAAQNTHHLSDMAKYNAKCLAGMSKTIREYAGRVVECKFLEEMS